MVPEVMNPPTILVKNKGFIIVTNRFGLPLWNIGISNVYSTVNFASSSLYHSFNQLCYIIFKYQMVKIYFALS